MFLYLPKSYVNNKDKLMVGKLLIRYSVLREQLARNT